MYDAFGLPNNDTSLFKVFYATGAGVWQVWNKPSNCRFVQILAIGGGGGGGGGAINGTTGTAISHSGGSGGCGSNIVVVKAPGFLLPDRLYVLVGIGGAGGAGGSSSTTATAGGTGSAGTQSYVCMVPSTTSSTTDALAVTAQATNGGTGGYTTASTSGTLSGSPATFNLGKLFDLYNPSPFSSQDSGGSSITGAVAKTIAYNLSGGTGGGAISSTGPTYYPGGAFNAVVFFPGLSGGASYLSGDPSGLRGWGPTVIGPSLTYPLLFTGGTGGGAGIGTVSTPASGNRAGDGGDGAYGCGGGGGGAGTKGSNGSTPNSGGKGGRGGDGLVIITAW